VETCSPSAARVLGVEVEERFVGVRLAVPWLQFVGDDEQVGLEVEDVSRVAHQTPRLRPPAFLINRRGMVEANVAFPDVREWRLHNEGFPGLLAAVLVQAIHEHHVVARLLST